jgi:predicted O-methyltransferase YrrM
MSEYEFTNQWFEYQRSIIEKHLPKLPEPVEILEIGAHEGRGTVYFIDNYLEHPESSIITVDPFNTNDPVTPVETATYRRFKDNIRKSKYPSKCTLLQEYSAPALGNLLHRECFAFDLILVDGSHLAKDVLIDAALSFLLLKVGGYIVFDDYAADGPKLAIDAFLSCNKANISIIHSGYHLIIQKI